MEWMFNIKDVIVILTLAASILGAYYSSRREIEQLKIKQSDMERLLFKLDTDINKELEELKNLQKEHSIIFLDKIENINKEMSSVSQKFAELTGFLKGRDIK